MCKPAVSNAAIARAAMFVAAMLWLGPHALAQSVTSATSVEAPLIGTEPATRSALRFNGFGTLGVAHSNGPSGWVFRRDLSQPGSLGSSTSAGIDSRLGLQLNYALTDQIELVAQAVFRSRNDQSGLAALEWAFAAYRPAPGWTLRLGRMNPDVFLLSDYRNVGYAYPWVRPEVGFYGLVPLYSITGADVTHGWNIGNAYWKAKAFGGVGSVGILPAEGMPDPYIRLRPIVGASLTREAQGWTLRTALVHMKVSLENAAPVAQLDQALAGVEQVPVPEVQQQAAALRRRLGGQAAGLTFVQFGAAYEGDRWLWSAEMANFVGQYSAARNWSAYTGLGRRFGPFTAYGMLAMTRAKDAASQMPDWQQALTPYLGADQARLLQGIGSAVAYNVNTQRMSQKSVSVGLRWDFTSRAALKLQWDRFFVDANGGALFRTPGTQGGRVDVGSASIDFVF